MSLSTDSETSNQQADNPLLEAVELLRQIRDAANAGQAEGLDPSPAARFIGVSVSKLHDMNARGLMPAPAQIGDSDRLPRWPRSELKAWLLAGAPSRIRWNQMRDAAIRKAGGA